MCILFEDLELKYKTLFSVRRNSVNRGTGKTARFRTRGFSVSKMEQRPISKSKQWNAQRFVKEKATKKDVFLYNYTTEFIL